MIAEKNLTLTSLPDYARVWVYQADRLFTEAEVKEIAELGSQFVQGWASHGKDLSAALDVIYNRFVVLAVDEQVAAASGCSIDSSVGWIRGIQEKFQVNLLDKMNITFRDKNEDIQLLHLNDFRDLLDSKQLDENTVVFNNLVANVGEFKSSWETTISNSWHKQLLP